MLDLRLTASDKSSRTEKELLLTRAIGGRAGGGVACNVAGAAGSCTSGW